MSINNNLSPKCKFYSTFFLRTVGAGTPTRSQILFLIGLKFSTLSSHWDSVKSSITVSKFSSRIHNLKKKSRNTAQNMFTWNYFLVSKCQNCFVQFLCCWLSDSGKLVTQKYWELNQTLLDSVTVASLKKLTEDIRTCHDLVRIPTFTNLCLAQTKQLERECVVGIIKDGLDTRGCQKLF